MRIAYDNYIDTASALTALTETAGYAVTNVQEQRLSQIYKSTSASAQTITIDLGSAKSINTIALMNHNFTTSASVIMSMNSSDSWPGATSQTITYNSGMMLKFFTAETYQFLQFQIDDPTNTDGFISIGRLWAGEYISIDPSSLIDFTVSKRRSDNVAHGRYRQKFASEGIGWREFKLDFPPSNETMVEKINTLYDTVGNHSSFIFCNFDTIRDYVLVEPCYVSIDNELEFNHKENMKFVYTLMLSEEK